MKIFGLTEKQILELRKYWLKHHTWLPDEESRKILIVRMMNCDGLIYDCRKDSSEHRRLYDHNYTLVYEYEITAKRQE